MSVNGVNGNSNPPPKVGIQSAQSEGTLVRNTSAPRQEEPRLSLTTQVSEDGAADASEVPAPPTIEEGGGLRERYQWLQADYERNQARLQRLEDLFERRDALESLAESGEKEAQDLLAELDQRRPLIDQLQARIDDEENEMGQLEGLADSDLANLNPFVHDADGDGLTDEAEIQYFHTDPDRIDSDGDGWTDGGEIWVQRHNLRFGPLADPLAFDKDGNGVPDGRQLPSTLRIDMPGNGRILDGSSDPATPASGGSGPEGTPEPGVGAQSEAEVQFHPAPADSPHLVAGESATDGTDPVVVAVSGDVTLTREDRNLVVETGDGRITIPYFDENGHPKRLVYFEGEPSSLHFLNLNPGDTQAVAGEDGYAVAGVYMASVPDGENVTYSYDPLAGVSFEDVDGVRRYSAGGVSGTFEIPEAIRGREVKQTTVTQTGEDIQVDLNDSSGTLLQRYILVGGAGAVLGDGHAIKFKGHDNGLLFNAYGLAVEFDGGAGDDIFEGLGVARGNGGNDWLVASADSSHFQAVTFDGGAGDDNVIGGDQADALSGGAGMDTLDGGVSDGDTMRGGGGSDYIIGQLGEGNYHIYGDGGVSNTSNVFGSGSDLHDIQSGLQHNAALDHIEELLADRTLTPERRTELERARDTANIARTETADRQRDLIRGYLRDAMSRKEAEFGIAQGETFDGDSLLAPAPPASPSRDPRAGGEG